MISNMERSDSSDDNLNNRRALTFFPIFREVLNASFNLDTDRLSYFRFGTRGRHKGSGYQALNLNRPSNSNRIMVDILQHSNICDAFFPVVNDDVRINFDGSVTQIPLSQKKSRLNSQQSPVRNL